MHANSTPSLILYPVQYHFYNLINTALFEGDQMIQILDSFQFIRFNFSEIILVHVPPKAAQRVFRLILAQNRRGSVRVDVLHSHFLTGMIQNSINRIFSAFFRRNLEIFYLRMLSINSKFACFLSILINLSTPFLISLCDCFFSSSFSSVKLIFGCATYFEPFYDPDSLFQRSIFVFLGKINILLFPLCSFVVLSQVSLRIGNNYFSSNKTQKKNRERENNTLHSYIFLSLNPHSFLINHTHIFLIYLDCFLGREGEAFKK